MSATLGMDVNYVQPAESTIDLAGMLDPSAVAEVAAPLSFAFASSNVSESHVDLSQFFRDENGNVLVHDQSLDATLAPKSNAKPVAAATPYPLGNTFGLHSNPGASKVIYLDFDGHTTTGSYWNSGYGSVVTPAFSFEGGSSFSNAELERIQHIWQRVMEDFLPFDVDVTTQDPGAAALTKSSGGDAQWGVRVAIGGSSYDWFGSGAGGVAYVGSFNWSTDTPTFVFTDQLANGYEKYTAEAISHEVGHTLGLYHDGSGSVGYYTGYGSGATGWAPIMGVGYYKELTQWSSGEYPGANNAENDLSIITTANGFGYRVDDHGNTTGSASALGITNDTVVSASGVIERNTDLDYFVFTTGAGVVNLDVDPSSRGPNLDILASLYDNSGNLIATSNPSGSLDANFNLSLAAGTYYISVEGVGKPAGADPGYSDYGSLGYFSISGTIVAATQDGRWTFDETSGTTAADSFGGDNAGTLVGATFVNDATRGRVLNLSGDSDRMEVGPAVNLGSQWTIASWFKDLAPGTWRTLTRGTAGDHQIIVNANGELGSYDNIGGTAFRGSGFNMNSLSTGWHHVAAVGSGGATVFYVDGVQVGSISFQSTSDVYALGNYQGGGQRFASFLDDARVYDRALSGNEVSSLVNPGLVGQWQFDETSGTMASDSAGGDDNGTLVGATFVNDASRGQVLSLSGSGDYVKINATIDLGSQWTITSWFKDLAPGSWRTLTRGAAGDHQIIVNANGELGSYDNMAGTAFRGSGFNMNSLSAGWHHVAAVGSGGATVFYVDGVQVGSITFQSTSDVYSLGNYQGGGQRFASYLDDARVYDRALSASEITALADTGPQAPVAVDDSYQVQPDQTFSINSPGVLANDTDADQDALTALLVSGPSNSQSFTLNADGSFSYTPLAGFTGTDSFQYFANDGGCTASPCLTLFYGYEGNPAHYEPIGLDSNVVTVTLIVSATEPGLVGQWQFDETSGTTASDSAGGDNHGTVVGATFVNDATRGRVLSLSGSGDHVKINSTIDLGSQWTISSWFKDLAPGAWRTLTRGAAGDHQIIVAANGELGSFDNIAGTFFHGSGFNMNSLSAGWHHVAAVGSGGSTVFYVDGVQVGSISFQSTSDVYALGNYQGGGQRFASFLDDARVYDRALSGSEISTLANPGLVDGLVGQWQFDETSGTTASDNAGGDNHGTVVGATFVNDASRGRVLSLSGSGDHVKINSTIDLGSQWTISSWFKDLAPGTWRTLTRGSVDDHQIIVDANGELGSYDSMVGTAFRGSGFNMNSLSAGWHHVAAVGSGGSTVFYVDGVQVGSISFQSTSDVYGLGNYQGGGQRFAGFLDDARVYDRALSGSEINALSNA